MRRAGRTSTRTRCARSNRKQALVPEGATVLEPVGTAPGLVVPPRDGRTGPTIVVLPGPPRELQPMWDDRGADRRVPRGRRGAATEYRQEMLRLFGIPESEIAETLRAGARGGHRPRRAGDHHVPAPRRGRGRHALRARAAGASTTRSRLIVRERHARHAVLRRRHDGRRAGRRAAATAPGADHRDRGVVHGRPAGGAPDRPRRARRAYVARRRRRLLQRGQDRAGRRRPGADRARTARCRSRSPRRWPTARRARSGPTSASASPASPGPAAAPRTSPWAPSASRSPTREGARLDAPPAAAGRPLRRPRPLDHGRDAPAAPRPARASPTAAMSARLFIAVSLGDGDRRTLIVWAREAVGSDRGAARSSRPSRLHLTLAFLGHRPLDEVGSLAELVEGFSDAPAPALSTGAALWLLAAPPARADRRGQRRDRRAGRAAGVRLGRAGGPRLRARGAALPAAC